MARLGLNKTEVRKARDLLLSQGRHPSVDAVRIALGNTGSKTTIHKYLKELEREGEKASTRQPQLVRTVQDIVEELAARLHDDADARVAAIQAAHELVLRKKDEEIGAMRKQIDVLTARLQEVEAAVRDINSVPDREGIRQNSAEQFGLGVFGTFFNTGRNGKPDQSLFSSLLSDNRSTISIRSKACPVEYGILSRIPLNS